LAIREDLRNIALIAHVDHGKTTLVDAMLKQSKVFHARQTVRDRIMDSNDLERERGITILAKNAAVRREELKINLVDTPGHADFGGEVERALNLVDGVLLLVDAVEGPMPQTRFVLRHALQRGLRAVVVVNKIDRPDARPADVVDLTFDLFVDLGADDRQAEFDVVYCDALAGRAGATPDELAEDLQPLFDAIARLPAPTVEPTGAARMLVAQLDSDPYIGRVAIGRLVRGELRPGMPAAVVRPGSAPRFVKVAELFVFENLGREPALSASAGEIVAVSGVPDIAIGDTLTDPDVPEALPAIEVEPPTVRMAFTINDSPLAGQSGAYVTGRQLGERLGRELERNVAMRVEPGPVANSFVVSGRGELHLAVLIETMRREGFEFSVGRPEVIMRREEGAVLEPMEDAHVDVADANVGAVMDMLGRRRGILTDMHADGDGTTRMRWHIPTRGMLGLRSRFLSATAGTGILHSVFSGYAEHCGPIETRQTGSLVALEAGRATAYALDQAQARGQLFIGPGEEVYGGMVVGRRPRDGDLVFNVCRRKQLTNHRKSFAEDSILLVPPEPVSLEMAIEFIGDDELVEVTPDALRLRKRELTHSARHREGKRAASAAAVAAACSSTMAEPEAERRAS